MVKKKGIKISELNDSDKAEMRKMQKTEEKKAFWLTVFGVGFLGVAIVVLLMAVLGGWFYVAGGSNAVMLNKVTIDGVRGYGTEEISEGFYFKYPIVQSATKISYRTQTVNFCDQEKNPTVNCDYGPLVPKDVNGVNFNVDLTIRYHIDQAQIAEFVQYKGPKLSYVEDLIKTAARADATRGVFGKYAQEDVPELRTNLSIIVFDKLQERINSEATGSLKPNFVVIEAVDIRNIDFNDEIEARIIEKLKKKQLAEEKIFDIEIAEKTREEEIIKADMDRQADIIRANGSATAILLEATAKATGSEKMNRAFQNMPNGYVSVRWSEAVRDTDKVIFGLESLTEGGNLLPIIDMNEVAALKQKQYVMSEEKSVPMPVAVGNSTEAQ